MAYPGINRAQSEHSYTISAFETVIHCKIVIMVIIKINNYLKLSLIKKVIIRQLLEV